MSERKSADVDESESAEECCAICLQPAELPISFPCSHRFCFLCAKGAGIRDKRCALCRTEIPDDFLTNPPTVSAKSATEKAEDADNLFVWFYEGYNGWWRYDDRNGAEIEKSYADGRQNVELLLAGHVYVVNFQKMIQFRKSEPQKRRRVKRDLVRTPSKGVAGLKIDLETKKEENSPSLADSLRNLTISDDS